MNTNRIFNFWFVRVIAFLLIAVGGMIVEYLIGNAFNLKNSGFAPLFILIGMTSIEYLRGGSIHTVGFSFDEKTHSDLIFGFMLGSLPIVVYIMILYAFQLVQISDVKDIVPSGMVSIIMFAILEELLFRGMIFQACVERFSFPSMSLHFSALFASAHVLNPSFDLLSMLNTFLAGLLFSYAWYHSRSLWLPIAIHIGWNLTLYMTGLTLSGLDTTASFIIVNIHPNVWQPWLNSAYGIEGTVYCTVMLIFMGFIISNISIAPQRYARFFDLEYYIHQSHHE
ncbi:MAG: lysostaphin resistance A-like protein [Bacteroidota bacterium]